MGPLCPAHADLSGPLSLGRAQGRPELGSHCQRAVLAGFILFASVRYIASAVTDPLRNRYSIGKSGSTALCYTYCLYDTDALQLGGAGHPSAAGETLLSHLVWGSGVGDCLWKVGQLTLYKRDGDLRALVGKYNKGLGSGRAVQPCLKDDPIRNFLEVEMVPPHFQIWWPKTRDFPSPRAAFRGPWCSTG